MSLDAPASETYESPGAHRSAAEPAYDGHWAVAGMAVGVLVVAVSYAMSRSSQGFATGVYWIGQLIVVGCAIAVALSSRLTARAASVMVLAFGIATALSKWMYSPLQLKFPDELQHLLSTTNLLRHDGYGYGNRALPISTQYPGLETVAAAVHRITGLGLDATGLLLGGLFHVTAVCLIPPLMRRMTGSLWAGTIAAVAYGANASFGFFNSMYNYENLALVFALIALLFVQAAARASTRSALVVRGVLAGFFTVATLVSHHLTVAGLCLALVVFAVVVWRRRAGATDSAAGLRFVYWFTGASVVVTLVWFSAVARRTWGYLAPYTVGFTGQNNPEVTPRAGTGRRLALMSNAPRPELIVAAAGLLLLFLICAIALLVELRRERRIQLVFLVGAAGLAALEIGRLVSGKGSEVAGRSAVFLYIPVAAAVGLAVPMLVGRLTLARRAVTGAVLAVAFAGGILIAWPAWWDRLPGGALIATQFERGQDVNQTAAAQWAQGAIPADQPITGDSAGNVLLTTRGARIAVSNLAPIFYAPRLNASLRAQLTQKRVRWAWVNTELPHTYSVDGSYYGSQSTYTTAPTAAALAKFDTTSGVDRVYDSGEVRIYNLTGFENP
jgi:hypothetical protein